MIQFKSDTIQFKSDTIQTKSDMIQLKSDRIQFKLDMIQFKLDTDSTFDFVYVTGCLLRDDFYDWKVALHVVFCK